MARTVTMLRWDHVADCAVRDAATRLWIDGADDPYALSAEDVELVAAARGARPPGAVVMRLDSNCWTVAGPLTPLAGGARLLTLRYSGGAHGAEEDRRYWLVEVAAANATVPPLPAAATEWLRQTAALDGPAW